MNIWIELSQYFIIYINFTKFNKYILSYKSHGYSSLRHCPTSSVSPFSSSLSHHYSLHECRKTILTEGMPHSFIDKYFKEPIKYKVPWNHWKHKDK